MEVTGGGREHGRAARCGGPEAEVDVLAVDEEAPVEAVERVSHGPLHEHHSAADGRDLPFGGDGFADAARALRVERA